MKSFSIFYLIIRKFPSIFFFFKIIKFDSNFSSSKSFGKESIGVLSQSRISFKSPQVNEEFLQLNSVYCNEFKVTFNDIVCDFTSGGSSVHVKFQCQGSIDGSERKSYSFIVMANETQWSPFQLVCTKKYLDKKSKSTIPTNLVIKIYFFICFIIYDNNLFNFLAFK